jgi:microcystin-dependent protein
MASKINPEMMDGGTEIGDFIISARASKTKCLLCDGGAYSRTTYARLFAEIGTKYGAGDGATTFNVPDPLGRILVIAGAGSLAESFAASAVTVATDLIAVQTNVDRWITGMKVRATTTGALPTGLALATDYYVIRVSATTIKLATTLANAVAGTAIDLTAQGSGTHTLTHSLTARAIGDKGGEEAHANVIGEMPSHDHTSPKLVAYQRGSGGQGTLAGGAFDYDRENISSGLAGGSGAHNNMPPFLVIGNLFIYAGV